MVGMSIHMEQMGRTVHITLAFDSEEEAIAYMMRQAPVPKGREATHG